MIRCLEDRKNHFINGKWVECKIASPKDQFSTKTKIDKALKDKIIKTHEEKYYQPYFFHSPEENIHPFLYNNQVASGINPNKLIIKDENIHKLNDTSSLFSSINKDNGNIEEKIKNLKILNNQPSQVFQNYFNNHLKNPHFYHYPNYNTLNLFDDASNSQESTYQNTVKIVLFKSESDSSTGDKDSDHSSNNEGSGNNSNGEGSGNSNQNSNGNLVSNHSGSNSNSNSGSNSGSNSNFLKINEHSKSSLNSNSNSGNNSSSENSYSNSFVSLDSGYKDASDEDKKSELNTYFGPQIHKPNKIHKSSLFHPY